MKADYYPFGMQMPGRSITTSNYRYGYTGKEKDPEFKGDGNSYDYGARQYDPRIGRWLSLDPLKAMYPSMTPYCYAGNTPISAKDPDGNLIIFVNGYLYGDETGPQDDIQPGLEYWFEASDWNKRIVGGPGSEVEQYGPYINAAREYFGNTKEKVTFVNGTGKDITSTAEDRKKAGYEYAEDMVENYRDMLKTLGPDEKIEFVTHSMGAAFAEGMIEYFQENAKDVAKRITEVVHLSACDARDISIATNTSFIKRIQLNTTHDNTLDWGDYWTRPKNRYIPNIDVFGLMYWSALKYQPEFYKRAAPKGKKDEYDSHYDTKVDPRTFTEWLPALNYALKIKGKNFDGFYEDSKKTNGDVYFKRVKTKDGY